MTRPRQFSGVTSPNSLELKWPSHVLNLGSSYDFPLFARKLEKVDVKTTPSATTMLGNGVHAMMNL
jgi:hypothetical protein